MSRSRTARWGSLAAALLIVAVGAPSTALEVAGPAPAPPPAATYSAIGSWQSLAEVNKHRRARGLVALATNAKLAATARDWSTRMALGGKLAHNTALFTTTSRQRLGVRMLGENVGFNFTVIAQHKAFMTSAGHRRNFDEPRFRTAGFAVVRDSRGYLWTTQVFALPAG